mmetsp:Transcript_134432/g.232528  ORF Transcript_134432/g.232528 Transcript_134432/m.232528 type:complete len:175 (+) Transcript_134432:3-527(+)
MCVQSECEIASVNVHLMPGPLHRQLLEELKYDFDIPESPRRSESLGRLLPHPPKMPCDEPIEDDCIESTSAESLASHDRREFAVILDRGLSDVGLDWGFDVEPNPDGGLKVVAIEDGLLEEWNDLWPSKKVEVGDIIVKVNGRSIAAGMLQVADNASQLELVIQRSRSCDETNV